MSLIKSKSPAHSSFTVQAHSDVFGFTAPLLLRQAVHPQLTAWLRLTGDFEFRIRRSDITYRNERRAVGFPPLSDCSAISTHPQGCLAREPEGTTSVSTDTLLMSPCFLSRMYRYKIPQGTGGREVAIRDRAHLRQLCQKDIEDGSDFFFPI